jgi:DNA polymerase elongation subunit (family B)
MKEQFIINDGQGLAEFKEYLKEESPEYNINGSLLITPEFEVKFEEPYVEFLHSLKPKSDYSDDLIFGKDKTENIVSIEIVNDELWLFKSDGDIEKRPMVYWLLSTTKLMRQSKRLQGSQHYRFITTFDSKAEYDKKRNMWRNKDIYCIWDNVEAAMVYYGITMFKGMKVEDLKVLSFDIEGAGLDHNEDSQVFMISNTVKQYGEIVSKVHFRVDEFEDAGEMIETWCKYVQKQDPDIINGHNVFGYDLDYLRFVAKQYDKKLELGRDCSPARFGTRPKKYRVDGSNEWDYINCKIFGRHVIDGMFLAVKYDIGRNYPNWKLKDIAEHEGLVKKDRQFYDAALIGRNWHIPEEREKIVAYGIDDSDDSNNLFYLHIPSFFYMAQSIAKPFQTIINGASGAWLNSIMVRSYLQINHSIARTSEMEYVAGGMSYGCAGVYSNVSKWDAKSYYPSTILAFDIYDREKDPNAHYLEMVRYFTNKRFEQKRMHKETGDSYYDDLQASSKVFINSAYGLLGTAGLNYNSFPNAQLITKCCRAGLQKCILWATGKTVDHWWGVDEKLYKKIDLNKTTIVQLKEKYDRAIEFNKDCTAWVPRGKTGKNWKVAYNHSRTATQDFEDFSFIDAKSELSVDDTPRHDWILVNIDTDSLSFAKKDGSPFSDEENRMIEKEINQIMYSEWEPDGEFDRVLVVKAKNYCLLPKGESKLKFKGSSLVDSKKEPALIEMLANVISSLIYENEDALNIYHKYVLEAVNIDDIMRWATKKSITKKVFESDRLNETKVVDAIEGRDVQIGDKVFLYSVIDGVKPKVVNGVVQKSKRTGEVLTVENKILRLADEFDGNYDSSHYLKRVYDTISILEPVLEFDKFKNYSLKKLQSEVDNIVVK